MSDVMLLGVLRMPLPDDPKDLAWTQWVQIKDRMRQSADELEARSKERDASHAACVAANEGLAAALARVAELEKALEDSVYGFEKLLGEYASEMASGYSGTPEMEVIRSIRDILNKGKTND